MAPIYLWASDPVDDTLSYPIIFTMKNISIILYCKRFTTQIECSGTYVRGQPGGVHDAWQFSVSSLATHLSRRQTLAEPIIHLNRMEIKPYLVGDTVYPRRLYMLKNFKPEDLAMVDKIRYGSKIFLWFLILFMLYTWYDLYKFWLWFFFRLHKFDSSVNRGWVIIEQAFGVLKNHWRILKAFNMSKKNKR